MTDTLVDEQRLVALEDELGDSLVVHEAVGCFLAELPARLARIREAVDGGDAVAIRDRAHALGSPAAMLGATSVRAVTRRLETAAPSASGAAALEEVCRELESVCDGTADVLRRYVASPLRS